MRVTGSAEDRDRRGRATVVVLSVVALVVVCAVAAWQLKTDATRPARGEVVVSGQTVTYELLSTGPSSEPLRVTIAAPEEVSGNLRWRLFGV